MSDRPARSWFLMLLALVFTVGLTFTTLELPYRVDQALQSAVRTPGLDSHSSDVNVLKTELFISHFRLRLVGYTCFGLVVATIIVGFATRRAGFAALGSAGLMLPVFAQFASVMFFLSGLGLLNLVWLPVLDVSHELQNLGLIVKVPYDLLRWLLSLAGVNGYWPFVISCVGGGLLIFFFSTLTWLEARSRGKEVADSWLYRFSRHPQYLGWILWSYGVLLLLEQQRYPKRSWGIGSSFPWMIAALVIIGVAAMEELKMSRRYGSSYDGYRQKTPFLLPMPAVLEKFFSLPQRIMFGYPFPKRRREVVAVLAVYAVLLSAASALFYGVDTARIRAAINPARATEQMETIARRLDDSPSYHAKRRAMSEIGEYGEAASKLFIHLLQHADPDIRALAVIHLERSDNEDTSDALIRALRDPSGDVRSRAAQALAVRRVPEAVTPLLTLINDPVAWVQSTAVGALARLGSEQIIDEISRRVSSENERERQSAVEAVGILGSEKGARLAAACLEDPSPWVRRAAVIALLQIGAPDTLEALQSAVDDSDWEVRIYATEALKRLSRD